MSDDKRDDKTRDRDRGNRREWRESASATAESSRVQPSSAEPAIRAERCASPAEQSAGDHESFLRGLDRRCRRHQTPRQIGPNGPTPTPPREVAAGTPVPVQAAPAAATTINTPRARRGSQAGSGSNQWDQHFEGDTTGVHATSSAPHPGVRINQYEMIKMIGEGGMGTVYLARDLRLGRRVAIKFLAVEPARADPALPRRGARDRAMPARQHRRRCTRSASTTTRRTWCSSSSTASR